MGYARSPIVIIFINFIASFLIARGILDYGHKETFVSFMGDIIGALFLVFTLAISYIHHTQLGQIRKMKDLEVAIGKMQNSFTQSHPFTTRPEQVNTPIEQSDLDLVRTEAANNADESYPVT